MAGIIFDFAADLQQWHPQRGGVVARPEVERREPPAGMKMVELGRFDGVEADILVGRLASEGIEATAAGRGLASLYPLAVTVLVAEGDLDAARRIVADAA